MRGLSKAEKMGKIKQDLKAEKIRKIYLEILKYNQDILKVTAHSTSTIELDIGSDRIGRCFILTGEI